ncbi:hypothetical protein [Cupriavidus pinatubonensis]|uniref:Uncharacterized protein n=1 Tax=Cupriavidus pinatubonensis TaxID=248026 RepID=A0ABN7Y6M0_9BURK|nr:hypothetical protein [Cupriavidus pinatubonensis]CAG9168149.1 hypothetical protein LMG23994_01321 [Cupriavidus pinatubonensis]
MSKTSDTNWVLHPRQDGKPSLGQLAVVSRLVREFVQRVLETRAAWHKGEPGAADPLAVYLEDARRMGNIFLGRDARYHAQPWNSIRRLGITLRVLLPEETEHYGDPGTALFMWLATQAATAAAAIETGQSEDVIRRKLDAVVDDVTQRLLGLEN